MPSKDEVSYDLFRRQTPLFLAIYHDLVNSDIIGELCDKWCMGRARLTKAIAFHIYSDRLNRGSFSFLAFDSDPLCHTDLTPASELVTKTMQKRYSLQPDVEIGYSNEQLRKIGRDTISSVLYLHHIRLLEVKDGVL